MAMRLTCPECAAQYDVDDALIPANGREVECAACGHQWHQPGPVAPRIVLGGTIVAPSDVRGTAGGHDDEDYDERGIDEETLAARPFAGASLKPSESVLAILREEAARELAQRGTPAPPPQTPPFRRDSDPAGRDDAPEAHPSAADRQPAAASSGAGWGDDAPDFTDADGTPPELIVAELVDDDDLPPPRPTGPLPDPQALIASLHWTEAAVRPQPRPVRPGTGRDAGFAVMVALSVLLVGAYVAAPPLAEAGRSGTVLMQYRHWVDDGRLWLHDRAAPIADRGIAAVRHLAD